MKSFVRSLVTGGWFVVVRFVGRLFGTPLIGATFARLSLGAALTPLAGFYGGTLGALSAGCMTLMVATLFHGSLSLASLVLYVPGVIGGLFFALPSGSSPLGTLASTGALKSVLWSKALLLRMAQPLFFVGAMVLFWVHPVGQQACLYPLLWVLPCVLVFRDRQSLFARALISSFAVHAVGACWWLYTMPMAPAMWHGMMPLVVVERVVQALLMVVVVKVVEKITSLASARRVVSHCALQ